MAKVKQKINVYIDELLCKGCDICIELCGEKVFTKSGKINSSGYYVPLPKYSERCTGCMICEMICPELAVVLEKSNDVKEPEKL